MAACYCVIRHAISPNERKWVTEALEYARSVGDSVGITVCLARLSPCPSRDPKSKRARKVSE